MDAADSAILEVKNGLCSAKACTALMAPPTSDFKTYPRAPALKVSSMSLSSSCSWSLGASAVCL